MHDDLRREARVPCGHRGRRGHPAGHRASRRGRRAQCPTIHCRSRDGAVGCLRSVTTGDRTAGPARDSALTCTQDTPSRRKRARETRRVGSKMHAPAQPLGTGSRASQAPEVLRINPDPAGTNPSSQQLREHAAGSRQLLGATQASSYRAPSSHSRSAQLSRVRVAPATNGDATDHDPIVMDLVDDSELSALGGTATGELATQRFADAARLLGQGVVEEVRTGSRNRLRQPMG